MDKKAIVIGAGGAGLAALNAMLEQGFETTLLEKNAEIGGVWESTEYPNLKIHSKSFNYRFIDFHAVKSLTDRATGSEVLSYMKDYASTKGLYEHILFNKKVNKILIRKDRKCEIYASSTANNEQFKFECDIVICALGFTNAGSPNIPHFACEKEYKGTIVHSSNFNNAMLNDILFNKKKVIVVGAGRSAHEVLMLFDNCKENATWLYAKSLWSFSFERLYDNKTIFSWYYLYLLYAYYTMLLKLRRKIPKYNWVMRWLQKPLVDTLFINPLEPSEDIFQTRRAMMPKDQFDYLRSVKNIKGKITKLSDHSVHLSNGQVLDVDYVILATGYDRISNLPEIIIEKADGTHEQYDVKTKDFIYNMLDPEVPEIALFTTELIYAQQIFGYSLAAQWLARFYSGKLPNINNSIDKYKNFMSKHKYKWYVPNRYLSNGAPYPHEKDNDYVLTLLLHDLGVEEKFAKLLVYYGTNEQAFNQVVAKIINELK